MPIDGDSCPRRVLAQTAKTRGGTLESPAYREKNYGVPEKISIFENTACKGLPKVRWGSNKQAKDSESVLYTTKFHTVKCKVSQQGPIVGRVRVIHRKSFTQLSAKFRSKDPLWGG